MQDKKNQVLTLSPFRLIFILAAMLFVIRLFSFDIMQIEGHSMEPTLKPGQVIIVNRLAYGIVIPFINQYLIRWAEPAKEDILVFMKQNHSQLLIKRCAATEGTKYRIREGFFYLENNSKPTGIGYSLKLELYDIVPKGHIIVFGDNLNDSIDSRTMGFIPVERIVGKIFNFSEK
jgi:signal peptidase I